jgi:hypothetical protein
VLPTTFALVRRIACLADHQKTALLFARINIVGVVVFLFLMQSAEYLVRG